VQRYVSGEMAMLPPTVVTLRELATYDSVAEVLAARREIEPLMPRPVNAGEDVHLVIDTPAGRRCE
jgi:hypothetical protein